MAGGTRDRGARSALERASSLRGGPVVKQVTQRLGDGRIDVRHVPAPRLRPGWVTVATRCSLISTGTERQKVELARQTLVGKARARPDLVRKTVEQARVEGVRSTLARVRVRLDAPAPMG